MDPELNFYIATSGQYSLPANTVVNVPLSDTIANIATNSQAIFSNNNTRADLLSEITLSNLSLELINPIDGNFNFVEAITGAFLLNAVDIELNSRFLVKAKPLD